RAWREAGRRDTPEGAARTDDGSWVARVGRGAGARGRGRRRDPTVAAERRLSRPRARGVSSIPRAGLREDHLDVTGGSRRHDRVDLPDRDAGGDDRSDSARKV